MTTLAWFIFAFTLLQFVVALVNLIFSQKLTMSNTNFNHLVSVLIPARNEEKNIATLLNDLLDHDYKNIEILVSSFGFKYSVCLSISIFDGVFPDMVETYRNDKG